MRAYIPNELSDDYQIVYTETNPIRCGILFLNFFIKLFNEMFLTIFCRKY